jgi:hypothetical protein
MPTLNPLNKFRTYNYRWEFGVLPASIFNTNQRDISSEYTIAASSGNGQKSSSVTTFAEETYGQVEFFVDDVEFDSLISPNPGSGTTTAIQWRFTVTEPYSVGLFFQAMLVAAQSAGYPNHIEAPYFLSLDFIGHTDSDTVESMPKRVYCLKLINVTFTADANGSRYEVTAIPFNHMTLIDDVQELPKSISSGSSRVGDIMNDIATELNRQEEDLVANGTKGTANIYEIDFPQFTNFADIGFGPSGFRTGISFRNGGRETEGSVRDWEQSGLANATGDYLPTRRLFGDVLRGRDGTGPEVTIQQEYNELGESRIVENFNERRNVGFGRESEIYDANKNIYNDAQLGCGPDDVYFQFHKGTKIEKIIESVLLASQWGQSLPDQTPDADNMISWYKVDTQIEILDEAEMQISGRPAMKFKYIVKPYRMAASTFQPPNAPANYLPNIENARKAYNYVYTGLNTDIIDFEFKIDNSFFKTIIDGENSMDSQYSFAFNDPGQRNNFSVGGNAQDRFDPRGDQINPANIPAPVVTKRNDFANSVGAGSGSNKAKIARLFNEMVLNSDVENIELTLKIWGDPYYLTDNDCGNLRSTNAGLYINTDQDIDYQTSEVDILVRFESGVDIKGPLVRKDPNNSFNGLYKIITMTSSFENGTFTQTITAIRRPNQTPQQVDLSNTIIDGFTKVNGITAEAQQIIADLGQIATIDIDNFITNMPPELEKFTRLGSINVESFTDIAPTLLTQALSGTQIGTALTGLNNFVNQGISLRNNLVANLGNLQNVPTGLDNVISQTQQALSDPTAFISQVATNELNDQVNRLLGPELRTQIRDLESQLAPISNLTNVGSNPISNIFPTNNPLSLFSRGIA